MPVPLAWFGGAVANNRIYVISGTPDGGISGTGDIWEYDPTMTGVGASFELPRHFVLEQNYPNPFNPTTVISYQLSVVSGVNLRVFDLLGREVAVLVNEEKPAGTYSVIWNATGFPSGLYFYALQAGIQRQTKGMMLIK